MSDLIRREDALALRDKLADIIGALPMSSIYSALSEYRNAIRARPAEQPEVKPLVWFEAELPSKGGGKFASEGYTIRRIEGLWLLDFAGTSKSAWRFSTLEVAKAAAQADYEARILAALKGETP